MASPGGAPRALGDQTMATNLVRAHQEPTLRRPRANKLSTRQMARRCRCPARRAHQARVHGREQRRRQSSDNLVMRARLRKSSAVPIVPQVQMTRPTTHTACERPALLLATAVHALHPVTQPSPPARAITCERPSSSTSTRTPPARSTRARAPPLAYIDWHGAQASGWYPLVFSAP